MSKYEIEVNPEQAADLLVVADQLGGNIRAILTPDERTAASRQLWLSQSIEARGLIERMKQFHHNDFPEFVDRSKILTVDIVDRFSFLEELDASELDHTALADAYAMFFTNRKPQLTPPRGTIYQSASRKGSSHLQNVGILPRSISIAIESYGLNGLDSLSDNELSRKHQIGITTVRENLRIMQLRLLTNSTIRALIHEKWTPHLHFPQPKPQ